MLLQLMMSVCKFTGIFLAGLTDECQQSLYIQCLEWIRQCVTNRAISLFRLYCNHVTLVSLLIIKSAIYQGEFWLKAECALLSTNTKHSAFKIVPRSCISRSSQRKSNNLIIIPSPSQSSFLSNTESADFHCDYFSSIELLHFPTLSHFMSWSITVATACKLHKQ